MRLPADFSREADHIRNRMLAKWRAKPGRQELTEGVLLRWPLANKLHQRFGRQLRCKPTVLPCGRILVPLYTDTNLDHSQ